MKLHIKENTYFDNTFNLTKKDTTRLERVCEIFPYVVISFMDDSFKNVANIEGYTYLEDAERDIMFDLVTYKTCSALYKKQASINQFIVTKYDSDKIDWSYFENLPWKQGGLKSGDDTDVVNYFNPDYVGVNNATNNIKKLLDMTKVDSTKNSSFMREDNDIDNTDERDDYIYYLEKKLNRIKSVDKLRKTLEELGFTQTDGIDYNTWDNYYGDDASFDTWEKDDIVVNFWYDEKYRTIETRVW